MGCMKWAFLFPRLLGNETMQAQECCRKGEAYRHLSLFCRHCSILGSFDSLKNQKSNKILKICEPTKKQKLFHPHPSKEPKQKQKKPGWTLLLWNVATKHAPGVKIKFYAEFEKKCQPYDTFTMLGKKKNSNKKKKKTKKKKNTSLCGRIIALLLSVIILSSISQAN